MQSIRGGLKPGEIGIIAAPAGLGKTSVLVQIALDKLLQDQKVIHVSFTKHSDYVLAWYEEIFEESVRKKNLEQLDEVKNEIVKNRVLMKFTQEGVTGEQILNSLGALIRDGGFNAQWIIIDGFDFAKTDPEQIAKVKKAAAELGLSFWYSCNAERYDKQGIPAALAGYADVMDVIVVLDPRPDHIKLAVVKDRETLNPGQSALRLDPKTLLMLEE
jgi:KaiC/GvpD/RAD55 family RecA-like ATPase